MGNSETSSSPRVADTVAATLHAYGIRHAFGMPGGEVVTLIDGLQRSGIRFHLARHESAAASMAAGVSVMTNSPGLLVTTIGPGLANAVNGIADAAQEHVPLVVISGIVDRPTRARFTHQVIDHAQLLRPLVKASYEIEPESAASTVARALDTALTEPMGPVHLDFSPAVAAMTGVGRPVVHPTITAAPVVRAYDPAIASLADRIERAERPIILGGFEAARAGAADAIRQLAEKIGAPVVTTYKGKGLMPEHHVLALGGAGLSPVADTVLLELIRQSDLVLLIGFDPIEMRIGWLDLAMDAARFVEITAAAPDQGMYHAAARIRANTAAVTWALLEAVKPSKSWKYGEVANARSRLATYFASPSTFGPHVIVDVLNEAAGDGGVVTVDSGAHRILLSQKWRASRPLSLLQSAGFCTMATALPLAIGAKIADPVRNVFAVVGDGGLEMGIGELATLRDLGLPVTVVVFQDRRLALIALKQASVGLEPVGVSLGETDLAAVARGFGGHGVNVDDAKALRLELQAAAQRDRFTLIACRFDADAYKNAF